MKLLREIDHTIGDRKFLLREFNGVRKSKLDDLNDQAEVVIRQMEECRDDLEKRRELRAKKKEIDFETYRVFLIPTEPAEKTPDWWFNENFSEGYFLYVVAPIQGALNRHEDADAVGKSIAAKMSGEALPAVNGQSVGPIFAAH